MWWGSGPSEESEALSPICSWTSISFCIAPGTASASPPPAATATTFVASSGTLDWERPDACMGVLDRSPCGTGTSAKLACLAHKGLLAPGEQWVQESVIGSRFIASYAAAEDGRIAPRISGRAYICGETTLVCQPGDPFASGIAA